MLKGDCNKCLHGNEPEDSEVCVECGIVRKNYTPIKAEYISRDLALSFPFAIGEYDHKNADPHFINGCETYKEWLEGLPAADVAEVRHGRWVAESYYAGPLKMWGWKCTACGAFSPVNEVKFYKFCPGCGAKMCEEGKDGQTT